MNSVITVKGIGSFSVKPDLITIFLEHNSLDLDYGKCTEIASQKIERLNKILTKLDFDPAELKTSDFSIQAKYNSILNGNKSYSDIFIGWECKQSFELSFELNLKRLGKLIAKFGKLDTPPKVNVKFSVKDRNLVNEKLLKSATLNARKKAETLCIASDVTLGKLVNIDYSWSEISLYSHTQYDTQIDYMCNAVAPIDINPTDIDVSDTVTFVWEILER